MPPARAPRNPAGHGDGGGIGVVPGFHEDDLVAGLEQPSIVAARPSVAPATTVTSASGSTPTDLLRVIHSAIDFTQPGGRRAGRTGSDRP